MIPKQRAVVPLTAPPTPQDAPQATTRTVVDWDFNFGPHTADITLEALDSLNELDDRWTIHYSSGEVLTIYKSHVRWTSQRERLISTPVPMFTPTIAT